MNARPAARARATCRGARARDIILQRVRMLLVVAVELSCCCCWSAPVVVCVCGGAGRWA